MEKTEPVEDGLRRLRRDPIVDLRVADKDDSGEGRGEDEEEDESKSKSLLFLISTLLLAEDEDLRSAGRLEAATSAEETDGDGVDELSFFFFIDEKP